MQYSNHKSTTIWDSADYRLKVTNKNNCRCAIFCLQSLFEQCNSTHHFVLSVMQISVMPARKPSPISFGFWHWPCIYSSVFYHGWSRTHCARSHFSVSSPAQLHPAYNSSVTFSSSAVSPRPPLHHAAWAALRCDHSSLRAQPEVQALVTCSD